MPFFVRGSTYQGAVKQGAITRERLHALKELLEERNREVELLRLSYEQILPLLRLNRRDIIEMKETLGEQDKQSINLTEIAGSEIFKLQVRALSEACTLLAEMAEWVESLLPHIKKGAQGAAREQAESFYRQMYTFLEEYSSLVGIEEQQQGQGGRPLFSQSVPPLTEEELEKMHYSMAETIQNIPPTATEIGESEEEEENKEDEPPILVGSVVWHTPDKEEKEEEKLGYE